MVALFPSSIKETNVYSNKQTLLLVGPVIRCLAHLKVVRSTQKGVFRDKQWTASDYESPFQELQGNYRIPLSLLLLLGSFKKGSKTVLKLFLSIRTIVSVLPYGRKIRSISKDDNRYSIDKRNVEKNQLKYVNINEQWRLFPKL